MILLLSSRHVLFMTGDGFIYSTIDYYVPEDQNISEELAFVEQCKTSDSEH